MGKSSKKPHKRGRECQALEERGVPVIVGTLRKAWLLPGHLRFHEDRRLSGALKVSVSGQSMITKGRGVENPGSGLLHRTNSDTVTKDRMEGW